MNRQGASQSAPNAAPPPPPPQGHTNPAWTQANTYAAPTPSGPQRMVPRGEAFKRFWTRWTIQGRASRSEYWWAQFELFLVSFCVFFTLRFLTSIADKSDAVTLVPILEWIWNLAILARRLQIVKAFAVRRIESTPDSLRSTLQREIDNLLKMDDKKSIVLIFNTEKDAVLVTRHKSELQLRSFTKGVYSTHHYTDKELKVESTDKREKQRRKQQHQQLRKDFYERADTLHITTIDCAQGHTFDKVIVVLGDKDAPFSLSGNLELLFTACSRARTALRVIDATRSHEVYELLKQFN